MVVIVSAPRSLAAKKNLGGTALAPEWLETWYAPEGGPGVILHTSREIERDGCVYPLPEGDVTNDESISQIPWEWIYPTQTGGSIPHLPVDVFTPCPDGGLTNDQSTKQRGRKWVPLDVRGDCFLIHWTTCPSRVGWLHVLTFYLSIDKTHLDEGFIPQLTGWFPHTDEDKRKGNGINSRCHQSHQ